MPISLSRQALQLGADKDTQKIEENTAGDKKTQEKDDGEPVKKRAKSSKEIEALLEKPAWTASDKEFAAAEKYLMDLDQKLGMPAIAEPKTGEPAAPAAPEGCGRPNLF